MAEKAVVFAASLESGRRHAYENGLEPRTFRVITSPLGLSGRDLSESLQLFAPDFAGSRHAEAIRAQLRGMRTAGRA